MAALPVCAMGAAPDTSRDRPSATTQASPTADPAAGAYERARSAFDYFSLESMAFMENAGGSQVPRCVAGAVSDYFARHYAQLGAGYPRSERAGRVVAAAHEWLGLLVNARGQGKVAIGPSTSQLAFNLACAYGEVLGPGDEVLLQEASHESVLGPWVRLAGRCGFAVRWWRAHPRSGASALPDLEPLLGPATRLVVVAHVSNLLGEILDLGAVVRLVRRRAPRAHVLADGVAYAPHRAMDVSGWGVDWYVWSAYKVYGPHVAVLYGRHDAHAALLAAGGQGPNHYFVDAADMSYKFELGGPSHEACAGLMALQDYLLHLLGREPNQAPEDAQGQEQDHTQQPQVPPAPDTSSSPATSSAAPAATPRPFLPVSCRIGRAGIEAAFALMTSMEATLQERLLGYLAAHPRVRLVGPAGADPRVRVPTISFLHRRKSSAVVARELQAAGFAVRCGHMYARRLVEALAGEGGLLAEEAAARQQGRGDAGGNTAAAAATGNDSGGGGGARQAFDVQRAVDEGVVRISLLHYNTPGEVEALAGALERIL